MVIAAKLNKLVSTSTPRQQHTGVAKKSRRKNTTATMVHEALIELHSAEGVGLRALMKYIMNKYEIKLTQHRQTLIKKLVCNLREVNHLENVTGTGFRGRFKLLDKNKFVLEKNKFLLQKNKTVK